jgi:hypothetical protein
MGGKTRIEFLYYYIIRQFKVLWTDHLCQNFELLVCLAILISQKTVIMESKFGCNEILKVCFLISPDNALSLYIYIY